MTLRTANVEAHGSRQPVNLHLTHGGAISGARWADAFVRNDPFSRNLVLESFGDESCYGLGLRLYDGGGDASEGVPDSGTLLEEWVLADPVREVRARHPEHAEILRRIVSETAPRHVYVSSLTGHSLEISNQQIPLSVFHHDGRPFCPAAVMSMETACARCDRCELERCRQRGERARPRNPARYYRPFRTALLAALSRAERHFAPSVALPDRLARLDRRFERLPFATVPEGVPFPYEDCFGGADEGRRLRVGWFCAESQEWGTDSLLTEVVSAFGDSAEVFTLRTPEDLPSSRDMRAGSPLSGRRETLPARLLQMRLDLAVLAPRAADFSARYVREIRACGLPIAVFAGGVSAEHVLDRKDGFVLARGEELARQLEALPRRRAELRAIARRISRYPVRSARDAVFDVYGFRADREFVAAWLDELNAAAEPSLAVWASMRETSS